MGKQVPISTSFNLPDGREVSIETGKLASLADGSVVVKMGKTMLFCSVVSKTEMREGQDFFPLSVDYQEKFAAAGRIPGNFFKREARLSEYEILICRLVDRAIRPLFPEGYLYDTQVIINLISADKDVPPDALAALACSAALSVSDIPFEGPISEVRVARIDGEFKINPNFSELENADMDLIVAGDKDNIMMVEGEAKECAEEDMIEAIKVAHEAIKVQCDAQLALAELVGEKATVKREFIPAEENEEIHETVKAEVTDKIYAIASSASDKKTRREGFDEIKEALKEKFLEEHGEEYMEENGHFVSRYFNKVKKATIREMMLNEKKRLDGRSLTEVRPIWCEVDYLPSAHGSAIFTRGETQSLTSLTLGTKLDEQMIDNALNFYYNKFILHYNFPAYSVGEVRPSRGPGRREVGHANLAARSLKQVLPSEENLAHTIRIVSDIMESNGSSSMATVCAGSLALMDAGVPIKSGVSGIAMGMISDGDRYSILSDILGDEDHLGDMDFKVTGTENGICACQMDIKVDGLSYDVLREALMQAKEGRLHILNEMNQVLNAANEDFKPHAPRMEKLRIHPKFIGAVIGPGGKVIQQLQKDTNTVINIEEVDDAGVVTIASSNKEDVKKALDIIKSIVSEPEEGDVFEEAKVKEILPFGVLVNFSYNKSGLVHISELSYTRIENIEDIGVKVGDPMKVKLIGVDKRTGKYRLSRKALMPKPEGWVERKRDDRRDRRGGDRRDNRGGRDRRDYNRR